MSFSILGYCILCIVITLLSFVLQIFVKYIYLCNNILMFVKGANVYRLLIII